jgi:Zn-dependent peptidase ImmA (M78 family)
LQGNNAVYIRNYFDSEVIFIRNDLNENHEMFYLRHEIGHAVLHVDVEYSAFCNKPKLEQQANYFAFKLSNISFDEIEFNEITIDQIASCLEVPLDPLKQIANTSNE